MAPVIRVLQSSSIKFEIVHSNQHYSRELDGVFFEQLRLPQPSVNLEVGSGSHAEQTGKVMKGLEEYFQTHQPQALIVHGDTNTALGAALSAKKQDIPLMHVEAGLRSGDESMPEEINRRVVDAISNVLFAPTLLAQRNLLKEGKNKTQVIVTGNTVVDAVYQHLELSQKSVALPNHPACKAGEYILVTAHRPSNVDTPESLTQLLNLLQVLADTFDKQVIWPIHPRTNSHIKKFGLSIPSSVALLEPVDYFQMLRLLSEAFLVATDSGGVQEEAFIMRKPLITLRYNTERPETLTANFLVGLDPVAAVSAVKHFLAGNITWHDKLGKGNAGDKIVTAIQEYLKNI